MALEIFVNTGPHGTRNFNFFFIRAKLYEDIDYHDEIQAITFLDNLPTFVTAF